MVLFTSKCVSLQKDDRQQKSHLLLPETSHTRSNKALEPTFKSFFGVNGLWHWDYDNFKVDADVVEKLLDVTCDLLARIPIVDE